jgi:hypothetical protein
MRPSELAPAPPSWRRATPAIRTSDLRHCPRPDRVNFGAWCPLQPFCEGLFSLGTAGPTPSAEPAPPSATRRTCRHRLGDAANRPSVRLIRLDRFGPRVIRPRVAQGQTRPPPRLGSIGVRRRRFEARAPRQPVGRPRSPASEILSGAASTGSIGPRVDGPRVIGPGDASGRNVGRGYRRAVAKGFLI